MARDLFSKAIYSVMVIRKLRNPKYLRGGKLRLQHCLIVIKKPPTAVEGSLNRIVSRVGQVVLCRGRFMSLKVILERIDVIEKMFDLRSRVGILAEEGVINGLDLAGNFNQLGDTDWGRHVAMSISRGKDRKVSTYGPHMNIMGKKMTEIE